GHLDGVRRGALAQVVADDPQVQAALVGRVSASWAEEPVVAAGGRARQRVETLGRVVQDDDSGCGREERPALVGIETLAGLHVDRFGMSVEHSDAGACPGYPEPGGGA